MRPSGPGWARAALALVLAFAVQAVALPLPDASGAGTKSKVSSPSTTKKKKSKKRRRPVARTGSQAALVMDSSTGAVLYEKNGGATRSIASLTKLMTAMVYLETEPDLTRKVQVLREDLRGSGKTQLRAGEVLTMENLLFHSLMSSDNAATKTLVRESGIPRAEYLARMNRKAAVLGLNATRFVEFTGIDANNVSSAYDLANLMRHALAYPEIALATSEPDYSYRSSRRDHYLVNTNRLARYGSTEVRGGKTGYIRASGYCLATCVRESGRDLISVVLGSPSNPARFNETNHLLSKVKTDLANQELIEDLEVLPGG